MAHPVGTAESRCGHRKPTFAGRAWLQSGIDKTMILKSATDETELELRVLGYQFPEIAHDEYDSNWLLVEIKARTPAGSWSSTDPCMLTWEAHWLLNWLADLVSEGQNDHEMSFLESNLLFSLAGKHDHTFDLRICVSGELRPPSDISAGGDEVEIRLQTSVSDLRECVSSLSKELRLFPVRAGGLRRCRPFFDPKTDCLLCGGAEPK